MSFVGGATCKNRFSEYQRSRRGDIPTFDSVRRRLPSGSADILSLPNELLEAIIRPLDQDLCQIRESCSRLEKNAQRPFVAKYFKKRTHVISQHSLEALVAIIERYGKALKTIIINSACMIKGRASSADIPELFCPSRNLEFESAIPYLNSIVRSGDYDRLMKRIFRGVKRHCGDISVRVTEQYGDGYGWKELPQEELYTFDTHGAMVGIVDAAQEADYPLDLFEFKLCEDAHDARHFDMAPTLDYILSSFPLFDFNIMTTSVENQLLGYRQDCRHQSLLLRDIHAGEKFDAQSLPLTAVNEWFSAIQITHIHIVDCLFLGPSIFIGRQFRSLQNIIIVNANVSYVYDLAAMISDLRVMGILQTCWFSRLAMVMEIPGTENSDQPFLYVYPPSSRPFIASGDDLGRELGTFVRDLERRKRHAEAYLINAIIHYGFDGLPEEVLHGLGVVRM